MTYPRPWDLPNGGKMKSSEGGEMKEKDYIWPDEQGHSPTVSWRIQNPEGFYSENWDEDQGEEEN